MALCPNLKSWFFQQDASTPPMRRLHEKLNSPFRQQCGSDKGRPEKADNFNKHIGSDVIGREAIPVPVRNVGGDCRKNSSDENKADSAAKTFDPGLSK